MNAFTPLTPTLADVAAILQHYRPLRRARREAVLSALCMLENLSGKSLAELPATVPQLAKEFEAIDPSQFGVAPMQLANVKRLCLSGVAASKLVPDPVRTSGRGRPVAPRSAELWNALPTQPQRNNVSSLVTWCNCNGVAPEAVDDGLVERVVIQMAASSVRPNQYRVRRGMTRAWNDVVEIFPGKNLNKVSIPPSRLRRKRIPLDRFPPSLLADLQGFAKWAAGKEVLSDELGGSGTDLDQ